MDGNGERQRTQAGLLGQAQRGVDDSPVGGGDQHTLSCRTRRIGRYGNEIEGRVVRGERQVTLELEPDHLPRVARERRKLDLLHGYGAPGHAEEDGAGRQSPRLELRTQRDGRTLGIDGEGLDARAIENCHGEAVAQQRDGQPDRPQIHACSVRDNPAICKTLSLIARPTIPEPRCCR